MTGHINIFVFAELFEQTHARAAGNETEICQIKHPAHVGSSLQLLWILSNSANVLGLMEGSNLAFRHNY